MSLYVSDPEEITMLEPLGVAHNGIERLKVKDEDVLVIGCGPVGLLAQRVAKVMGAKRYKIMKNLYHFSVDIYITLKKKQHRVARSTFAFDIRHSTSARDIRHSLDTRHLLGFFVHSVKSSYSIKYLNILRLLF